MPEDEYSGKEEFVEIPNPYRAYDIESEKWFYHEHVISA